MRENVVAAELVGAEQVRRPTGPASGAAKSVWPGSYGAISGAKIAIRMNSDRQRQAGDRHRPAQEPPPHARAAGDARGGGTADDELRRAHTRPAIRIRGLSTE